MTAYRRFNLFSRSIGAIAALLDMLVAGVRIGFALPLDRSRFGNPAPGVAGSLLLAFALVVAWLWLASTAEARFWIWGFAMVFTQFALWVAGTCLIIGHVAGLPGRTLANSLMLIVFASLAVVLSVYLILLGADMFGLSVNNDGHLLEYCTSAWLILIMARVTFLAPQMNRLRRVAAVTLYSGLVVAVSESLPRVSIFYDPYADGEIAPIDVESVYYNQAQLVARQLQGLRAERAGQIDLFFVGIAPFGHQDVFMRETLGAKATVESNFDATGHSIALITNPATLDRWPLANLPNVTTVLRELGQRMDRSQDIAFVFLTSHGSEDAYLAAELDMIEPNPFGAVEIRRALDTAGIVWRIIVVSACYSGSFIDSLRSPTSLIIAAAGSDRSSFGCEHKNKWTYFGEAFFEQALNQTSDLEAAFQRARRAIEKREKEEGKPPSQPQIFIGERIRDHLGRWRAERETIRPPPK